MSRLLPAAALALFFEAFGQTGAGKLTNYPTAPIRLVVAMPPGTGTDIAARIIAQGLSETLGQPIVIDNKPGADGAIGGDAVAKASPNGYTLFFATNSPMSAVPVLHKNAPYDPIADFTPIIDLARFSYFLFAHPSVPANSVAQLVAYARANPGKLNYGTGNTNSILAAAQFLSLTKLQMLQVPYKGDSAAVADFLNGNFQIMFAAPVVWVSHVKEGKLKVLATLLGNRSPMFPEAPTMAEAGITGMSITAWGGLFGPARLPREIVDRLNRDARTVMGRKDIRDQLIRQAIEPRVSTPEELNSFVREQLAAWRAATKEAGIKAE